MLKIVTLCSPYLQYENRGHLKQVPGQQVDLLHNVGESNRDLLAEELKGLGLGGGLPEVNELFDGEW